jgi:DNA-binding NarL/FixJ family response regulator
MRSAERADHVRAEPAVRASLAPERLAVAWADGRSMTVQQAVEYACSSASPEDLDGERPDERLSRRRPVAGGHGLELTPREREVAALVARGLTDPQIAATLAIGTRTVETHVANCRAKLDLATRAQLAVWAVRHGVGAAPD